MDESEAREGDGVQAPGILMGVATREIGSILMGEGGGLYVKLEMLVNK